MQFFMSSCLVALGGALGATLRYWWVRVFDLLWMLKFPVGTLGVNILGSFFMGLLVPVLLAHSQNMLWRYFCLTGLLGGFTTFSAFSMETIELFHQGQLFFALLYVVLSVVFCIIASAIGYGIAT